MAKSDLQVSTGCGIAWTPEEGSRIVLPESQWSLAVDPGLVEMTNGRDGRVRKGTLKDYTVNFTAFYDAEDAEPGIDIVEGTTGIIELFMDPEALEDDTDNRWYLEMTMDTLTISKQGEQSALEVSGSLVHNGGPVYRPGEAVVGS